MRIIKTTAIAITAAIALAACGSPAEAPVIPEPSPVETVVETPAPVAPETPVVEEPIVEEEPEAPEFSQIVDGVLYEGTKKLPVRIGEDPPGAPPAFEATQPTVKGVSRILVKEEKYLAGVMIGGDHDGYYWIIQAPSSTILANSSTLYGAKGYFPTREAALKAMQEHKINGERSLDRAEYLLVFQQKYGTYNYIYPDQQ